MLENCTHKSPGKNREMTCPAERPMRKRVSLHFVLSPILLEPS